MLETLEKPSLLVRSVGKDKVIHKAIPADRLLSLNNYARPLTEGIASLAKRARVRNAIVGESGIAEQQ